MEQPLKIIINTCKWLAVKFGGRWLILKLGGDEPKFDDTGTDIVRARGVKRLAGIESILVGSLEFADKLDWLPLPD